MQVTIIYDTFRNIPYNANENKAIGKIEITNEL